MTSRGISMLLLCLLLVTAPLSFTSAPVGASPGDAFVEDRFTANQASKPATSKPAMLYLALGDSLTAGLGSTVQKGIRPNNFVARAARAWQKDYHIRAKNLGIPGLNSEGFLLLWQNDPYLKRALKYTDIVTITMGGNDVLPFYREEAEYNELLVAIGEWEGRMLQVLKEMHAVNPATEIYLFELYNPLLAPDPFYPLSERVVREMNRRIASWGVKLQEEQSELNGQGTAPWLQVVPIGERFAGRSAQLTNMLQGDVHPNDSGYAVMAEQLITRWQQTRQAE